MRRMNQPKQLPQLVAIGVLLSAPMALGQTTPVAVIQTPKQVDEGRASFSPDGKWIATIDQDGRNPTLWDVKTGRKVVALPRARVDIQSPGGSISSTFGPGGRDIFAFSQDGRYLAAFDAATTQFGPPVVWDRETGEVIGPWKLDAANHLRLSGANWTDTEVRAWPSLARGTLPASLANSQQNEPAIPTIAISANGEMLAVGRVRIQRYSSAERTNSIEVWSLRGSKPPYTFAKDLLSLTSLAFSHDSEWLGAASLADSITGRYTDIYVGQVRLWHVADRAETKLKIENATVSLEKEWPATNVAFSPDNKQLVADVFTVGDLPDRDCPPDERCGDLESLPYDVRTTFFDVATGGAVNSTPLGKADSSVREYRRSFWLSPDGRRAFALQNKFLPINTLTGHHLSTFKAFQLPPQPGSFDDCEIGVHAFGFAAFSADVKQVAVSDGQQLEIVDAKTGASTAGDAVMLADEPNEAWQTLTAAFSPSGGTLAVTVCTRWLGTGKLRLYNASKLQEFAVSKSDSVLTSLAFTPDGALLFTGGYDGAVRIWETQHGSLVATLVRSKGGEWIVFTPDGLYDASANGASLLAWRLKGQIILASELPDMRLPGLLSKLVSGEHPKSTRPLTSAIANALPHSDR